MWKLEEPALKKLTMSIIPEDGISCRRLTLCKGRSDPPWILSRGLSPKEESTGVSGDWDSVEVADTGLFTHRNHFLTFAPPGCPCIGLARVSTDKQNSLWPQAWAITTFASENGLSLDRPVRYAIEGAEDFGKGVWSVISEAQRSGRVIIVTGRDRFSRKPIHDLISQLKKLDVYLLVLNSGGEIDPNPLAELTQGEIKERGRKLAERYRKANGISGKRVGRPKKHPWLREQIVLLHEAGLSVRKIVNQMQGLVSRSTVHRTIVDRQKQRVSQNPTPRKK